MIYPSDFEDKIGFTHLRTLLKEYCSGQQGKGLVDEMQFSTSYKTVKSQLCQTDEMVHALSSENNVPSPSPYDIIPSLAELKAEGSFIPADRLLRLRQFLDSMSEIRSFCCKNNNDESETVSMPYLAALFEPMALFPELSHTIDRVVNKFGEVKENASPKLYDIVKSITSLSASMSNIVRRVMARAVQEGIIEKDTAPAIRDGRPVIPVSSALKKSINGIVHDISATGKTSFIEPAEVVEAGNRMRELEMQRHREEVVILMGVADEIRPLIPSLEASARLAAQFDFIIAKARLAILLEAQLPILERKLEFDWFHAVHPTLKLTLMAQGREVVPFNLHLDRKQRFLVISGPNAGGKSVTLKTTGILQYMLQCGLLPTLHDNSHMGLVDDILIDIGDQQSIENDLSTYSSHLRNMKYFVKNATDSSLVLIDEIGSGTEPQIGSALAQAVLSHLGHTNCFGIVTTHYQNIKTFADNEEGFVNGAMLYDRQKFTPLFQLSVGHPGSSFAIEIARSIGLPQSIIDQAKELVGSDYINMDKYLLDIARDRRYWANKRLSIKEKEHRIDSTLQEYESRAEELRQNRAEILRQARSEAKEILSGANARIENTIHEIKKAQAEKEQTKAIRSELEQYKKSLQNQKQDSVPKALRPISNKRKSGGNTKPQSQSLLPKDKELQVGTYVKMYDGGVVGQIMAISGKKAEVAFGALRTIVALDKLKSAAKPKQSAAQQTFTISSSTSSDSRERQLNFKQDIDLRGMRADEALQAVTYFIDDAIQFEISRVRILHGTGTGALRMSIRQWLSANPAVKDFHDEDVRFGGAGITVVDLK